MKRFLSTVMVALLFLTALSAEEAQKYRVSLISMKFAEGVTEKDEYLADITFRKPPEVCRL